MMLPPPKGESLKNVVERVKPYFEKYICTQIYIIGKNVLIVAHGNSLRSYNDSSWFI